MRSFLTNTPGFPEFSSRLLEELKIGAFQWEVTERTLRWSDNLGPLFGRRRGLQPRLEEVVEMIHPDDRPAVDRLREGVKRGDDNGLVEFRATWPDGSVHWLQGRWYVVRDELRRPRTVLGLVSDITEARRDAANQRFLAEAGTILSSSLDYGKTLQQVADLVVPSLADWCLIRLLEGDELRLTALAHSDPARAELAWRLGHQLPHGPDSGPGVALRENRTVLIPVMEEEALAGWIPDPEQRRMLVKLGARSGMAVPLRVRDHTIGVLTLFSARPEVHYGAADVALVEEVAARAAVAIENARLHRQVEEAAARLGRVHDVASRLATAASVGEVSEIALEGVIAAAGAARGVVVLEEEGGARVAAASGYTAEQVGAWAPQLASPSTPVGAAFHRGRPVVVRDPEEMARRFPEVASLAPRSGSRGWAAFPLRGRHLVLGAIGLGFGHPAVVSGQRESLVEAIVRLAGVALERSRLFERTATMARSLQEGLIPRSLPALEGMDAAFRYLAGGEGEVGGDWFDLLPIPDGTVAAVVGDVVGRGIPAVSAMAEYRHGLRTLLLQGWTPPEALAEMNRVAGFNAHSPSRYTTACCVRFERPDRMAEIAGAGHVPPVLKTPEGARLLYPPRNPPLGVEKGRSFPSLRVRLPDEAILVLYSDGTVERRGQDLLAQIERLVDVVESADFKAEAVVDAICDQFAVGDTGDDITVLAVHSHQSEGVVGR